MINVSCRLMKMRRTVLFPIRFLVKARCKPSIKWRIVDEFGPETLEELPDGDFMFTAGYSDKENLFCWILSLGDQIELLEPCEFRRSLQSWDAVSMKFTDRYQSSL